MKKLRTTAMLTLIIGLLAMVSACNNDDDGKDVQPGAQTIAQIATTDANYSIFGEAITKADLTSILNDNNIDYTVFAPTNAAFTELFTAQGVSNVDGLIAKIGADKVKSILLYHIISGDVLEASDITTGWIRTAAEHTPGKGDFLTVYTKSNNGVYLNGDQIKVTQPDISASNGIIHQIDHVLMPLTIHQIIEADNNLSTLKTAVDASNDLLKGALDGTTDFTLFAPDNASFSAVLTELGVSDVNALVTSLGGADGISNVLFYHAIAGNMQSNMITAGVTNTALAGKTFTIATSGGVKITDGRSRVGTVIYPDIQGTNGVVHVIDKVLLPE